MWCRGHVVQAKSNASRLFLQKQRCTAVCLRKLPKGLREVMTVNYWVSETKTTPAEGNEASCTTLAVNSDSYQDFLPLSWDLFFIYCRINVQFSAFWSDHFERFALFLMGNVCISANHTCTVYYWIHYISVLDQTGVNNASSLWMSQETVMLRS